MTRHPVLLMLALVVAGFAAYWLMWSPSAQARQTCNHLEELCGVPADGCIEDMREATPKEIAEVERCVMPADSCIETVGCLAGSAMRQFGKGAMRGLLR